MHATDVADDQLVVAQSSSASFPVTVVFISPNSNPESVILAPSDTTLYEDVAKAGGVDSNGAFVRESYDAAALIVLAAQAGNSADRASIAKNVMNVANAPGTKIYPGELKKGLELLAKGKKINYIGASDVTFTDVGEANGSFLEMVVKGDDFKGIKQR